MSSNRQQNYWYFKPISERNDKHDTQKFPVSGNSQSRSGTPLIEAALVHAGVLLMSSRIAEPYEETGQFVKVLDHCKSQIFESGNSESYTIYKANRYIHPGVRTFIDLMRYELDQT
ncbi:MAG: DNA-binding transcriptional LysR family regulator [Flavobacteriales bacterium]